MPPGLPPARSADNVVAFPAAAASLHPAPHASPLPARQPASVPACQTGAPAAGDFSRLGDVRLSEAARRLGFDGLDRRTQIAKLRALATHSGMPLPRNPRIVAGVPANGVDNICAASRWDRGRFLAWLDHFQSPPAAQPSPVERQLVRDVLANRAHLLVAASSNGKAAA